MRHFILVPLLIALVACTSPAASPAPQPQATSPAALPAATDTSLPVPTDTASPSPTPAPSQTPTPPPPAAIGLENFSQLVTLHDYARDIEAVIDLKLPDYGIYSPVFSPDGQQLAVPIALSKDRRVLLILEVATGDLVNSIPLGEDVTRIYGLNFSPDGQTLIYSTLSKNDTGSINIWDLAAQKPGRVVWSKRGSSAYDISFSPDGKQIVAMTGSLDLGGRSMSLIVWDAATGDQLKSFPADAQYGIDYATFSASGNRLILSTGVAGRQLTVYDAATWQVLSRISPPNSSAEVTAISPDGNYVMTSRQSGGHLLLWEAATGKLLSTLDTPFTSTSTMEFSPDGSMLVVSGSLPFNPQTDYTYLNVAIWDTATWKQVGFQYWGRANSMQFSPDGKSLLASTGDYLYLIGLPDQEIQAADQAVVDFTAALGKSDYPAAGSLFYLPTDYQEYLKSKGLMNDPLAILQTVCEKNALPCLPATVVYTTVYPGESRGTVDYYEVLVRFTKPDGSIYADAYGATLFDLAVYPVADGSYKVDLFIAVDLETVLKK
jgi:WD40 repeat protein